jgi:translation initiation factor 2 alpha subunit (eIF-2alpha)
MWLHRLLKNSNKIQLRLSQIEGPRHSASCQGPVFSRAGKMLKKIPASAAEVIQQKGGSPGTTFERFVVI